MLQRRNLSHSLNISKDAKPPFHKAQGTVCMTSQSVPLPGHSCNSARDSKRFPPSGNISLLCLLRDSSMNTSQLTGISQKTLPSSRPGLDMPGGETVLRRAHMTPCAKSISMPQVEEVSSSKPEHKLPPAATLPASPEASPYMSSLMSHSKVTRAFDGGEKTACLH